MNNTKPKHGDQKNKRMETTVFDAMEFTAGDTTFKMPIGAVEQTVSERFCDKCDEWVTAEGVLGAMFCPNCGELWRRK
jgi:predicted RNA-binding Zn-ribbon protein involved in translation (DUF1610 family)